MVGGLSVGACLPCLVATDIDLCLVDEGAIKLIFDIKEVSSILLDGLCTNIVERIVRSNAALLFLYERLRILMLVILSSGQTTIYIRHIYR